MSITPNYYGVPVIIEYKYDSLGNLIQIKDNLPFEYSNSAIIEYKASTYTKYKNNYITCYSKQNGLTIINEFNNSDTITYKIINQYDEKHRLISSQSIESNSTDTTGYKYYYDAKGQIIKKEEKGISNCTSIRSYNNYGFIVKDSTYNNNGPLFVGNYSYELYEIFDHIKINQKVLYSDNSSHHQTYTFDKFGNWINKIDSIGLGLVYKEDRNFHYR